MSLSGFVRCRCTPLIVIVWVALQASSAHGQQRGGTPQTDKVQPVNSGANPYRVIRNWAQAPEGREWGGSNGVAIDPRGRAAGATARGLPGNTPRCLGTERKPRYQFARCREGS